MAPQKKAILYLLFATITWGLAFPINRMAVHLADPISFTGVRYMLGAIALLPLALHHGQRPAPGNSFDPAHLHTWLWAGFLAGILISCATIFQYTGLSITTSSKSGFLSALYVTLVPCFVFIIHGNLPERPVWIGLGVGLFGLALVCGSSASGFNRGDAYTIVADLFWAGHVLVMGHFALKVNPWRFVAAQAAIGGIISLSIAFMRGSFIDYSTFITILPYALWGVLSVSVAYTCQVYAQKYLSPAEASLIMQLQAIIAAIVGVIFLHEVMTKSMWVGATLVIVGSIIAQNHSHHKVDFKNTPRFSRGFFYIRLTLGLIIVSLTGVAVFLT
ncbi:MAG: DMT family transporter [Deltaproteobacteria bacterium]|jgi:drug/metabolite transporter (DMT)-like permease|nr:DMT family transporter [Deltaproteobacteria bacterium]